MSSQDRPENATRTGVGCSVASSPIFGVVRTTTSDEAERQARAFIRGGLELIEITLTVPGALELIAKLRSERPEDGAPWIGAGTVTTRERAVQALDSGAEFLLTPNVTADVAAVAHQAGTFLILGALTPTEICSAHQLGADLVKVYPLPPVGGAAYLATVRQPLDNVPILAAGGFGASEIPAYRNAGAIAFGLGSQLLEDTDDTTQRRQIQDALAAARGSA
jgi:2-dehydro-3-deoxyphosphogluconate aldolase/(4S)-4-hydroxy-2-oxoglutarate aldolase